MFNPFSDRRSRGLALIVVLLALAWLAYRNLTPNRQEPNSCYSVDDGKSYFSAPYRVPPFDYHGKPAYRAMVYTFHDDKPPFVAYLMRFTPQAKAQLEASPPDPANSLSLTALVGLEVKRPGETNWVPALDPANPNQTTAAYQEITAVPQRADGRLPMPLMPE
jgi:hypothetical protein